MIEHFDILDKTGSKTGETLPRNAVHERGLWHGSVQAWIMNGAGKFLLQQRSLEKKTDPGLWDVSICGHISAGDDAAITVVREAEEELSITINPTDIEELFLYIHENEHVLADGTIRYERLITPTVLVRMEVDTAQLRLLPAEVAAVRWISFDGLDKALHDSSHEYSIRADEWIQLKPRLEKAASRRR